MSHPSLNHPPPPFPSPMVAAVWAERKMMWEDDRSCDRSTAPILFPFSGALLNHLQDYFLDYSQAYEEASLHMDRTPPGLMSASNLHSRDRDKDGGWERRLPRHCHSWSIYLDFVCLFDFVSMSTSGWVLCDDCPCWRSHFRSILVDCVLWVSLFIHQHVTCPTLLDGVMIPVQLPEPRLATFM